jgi:transcriptional regulator with XRE-family HTH domain
MARLTGQSSPAHLSHWEKGRKLPSLSNALRLSAATKCPVEVLFFDLFDQLRNETYENKKKHQIEYTFD